MNNYVKIFLVFLLVTAASFGIHSLVLSSLDLQGQWAAFDYTLMGLYTFAAVASLLVTIVFFMAQYAMPNQVGFVFLGLVLVKVIASYIYIQAGLDKSENDFLKLNFLVSFFVFLFYDVFVAYVLVNQEPKAVKK